MLVNADFSRFAIIPPEEYRWTPSPVAGIERVMLDRIGGETARATSIVRYAAGSCFPAHVHPGGEEILVLSGSISDGVATYGAGCYLRNPPGSAHRPCSDTGALLFVKLWQMSPDERRAVRIDTGDLSRWTRANGRDTCHLFAGDGERVCLQRIAPGDAMFSGFVKRPELLVLEGSVRFSGVEYGPGSWIRLPAGEFPEMAAGARGVELYLKTGGTPQSEIPGAWQ